MSPPAETDVRALVLAAAVQLIEAKGLAAVSMREVARLAGVSHQLPYHYFVDREGILAALAEAGFELFAQRLGEVAGSEAASEDKIASLGHAYVTFACDHPAHFRVMFRNDFVPMDRHPSTSAVSDRCFSQLTRIGKEVAADLRLAAPDEEALTLAFWSLAHGLACLFLDAPRLAASSDDAQAREATTRRVMEAIRLLVRNAKPRRRG